jgi:hypothetical protein
MKFDRRIVFIYGLMAATFLGWGVYNALHRNWVVLAICLGMIVINAWMAYPSMLSLARGDK